MFDVAVASYRHPPGSDSIKYITSHLEGRVGEGFFDLGFMAAWEPKLYHTPELDRYLDAVSQKLRSLLTSRWGSVELLGKPPPCDAISNPKSRTLATRRRQASGRGTTPATTHSDPHKHTYQ